MRSSEPPACRHTKRWTSDEWPRSGGLAAQGLACERTMPIVTLIQLPSIPSDVVLVFLVVVHSLLGLAFLLVVSPHTLLPHRDFGPFVQRLGRSRTSGGCVRHSACVFLCLPPIMLRQGMFSRFCLWMCVQGFMSGFCRFCRLCHGRSSVCTLVWAPGAIPVAVVWCHDGTSLAAP
jgi:hypothetical protein